MKKQNPVFRAAPFVIGILSGAGMIWFAGPVHWNVLNIGNALGFTVCALFFLFAVFFSRIVKACGKSLRIRRLVLAFCVLSGAGLLWCAVLSSCMIAGTVGTPPKTATVLVLGSKVSGTVPSADLRVRIETASEYLKTHPQAVCIASGGQGPGEHVTEASLIRRELMKDGISGSRIFLEERSTTTKENVAYSLEIAQKNHLSLQIAVVTDDYHQFRAARIVRAAGAEAYPVPAPTPWYIFSACWARELLALTYTLLIP